MISCTLVFFIPVRQWVADVCNLNPVKHKIKPVNRSFTEPKKTALTPVFTEINAVYVRIPSIVLG
jgi:hypothetical protein